MKTREKAEDRLIILWTKIMVFFLVLIHANHSRAQIYYTESGKFTDTTELYPMFRKAYEVRDSLTAKLTHFQLYMLEANGNKYLTVDGLFNMYKWKDRRWVDQYKRNFGGYNNWSTKFVYNNEIYSFGGYGYWRCHGELIRFLWNKKEWEMVAYGDSGPVGTGFVYYTDGKLNVINPVSFTDAYVTQRKHSPSFSIDMKTMKTSDKPFYFQFKTYMVVDRYCFT